ncbi:hypothetical protein [Nocardia cyriacigeorgica]|uniref:hypothetical protein n=1 Tax=Nocardia cyriacigeorgica TaxID=135487 RepID=UPI002458E0B5|nr:hypothetical protein [Nocardia cyriacigeorgica]
MGYARVLRTAFGIAITGLAIGISQAGAATAGETGTIIGRENCEETARMYRDAGYNARCYHIRGERFYVQYDKPRDGEMPSTGSFGSS